MRFRPLGTSGVQVSVLGLGAMMLGPLGGGDQATADAIIGRAIDAGVNLIDTADVYSAGASEEAVGRAIRGRRADLVVATKFRAPTGDGPNRSGGARRHVVRSLDASLRRLGVDHIDLYQMHRPDPLTAIDETLEALDDAVRAGKVGLIGHSNFDAHEIVEARWAAERRRCVRFGSEQPAYSLLARAVERDVLPTCARHGLGVLAWSPLNGGWLGGRHRRATGVAADGRAALVPRHLDPSAPGNARKLDLVEELIGLARDIDATIAELAIAWVLVHPAITCALVGPRTPEQLEGVLGAAALDVPDEVLDRIDQLVAPGENVTPDHQTPDDRKPVLRGRVVERW